MNQSNSLAKEIENEAGTAIYKAFMSQVKKVTYGEVYGEINGEDLFSSYENALHTVLEDTYDEWNVDISNSGIEIVLDDDKNLEEEVAKIKEAMPYAEVKGEENGTLFFTCVHSDKKEGVAGCVDFLLGDDISPFLGDNEDVFTLEEWLEREEARRSELKDDNEDCTEVNVLIDKIKKDIDKMGKNYLILCRNGDYEYLGEEGNVTSFETGDGNYQIEQKKEISITL